jgi:hypothetical protein
MAKDKLSTDVPSPPPVYTDTDKAALEAASDAGITSPSTISDTHMAGHTELHQRVQALELAAEDIGKSIDNVCAIIAYIVETFHRGMDIPAILDHAAEKRAGSEVLDPTAKR